MARARDGCATGFWPTVRSRDGCATACWPHVHVSAVAPLPKGNHVVADTDGETAMSSQAEATEGKGGVNWAAVALGVVALAGLVLAYRFLPLAAWIGAFQDWVHGHGALGVAIFVAVYALTTFALVPGSLLTLAAGVVWGLWAFPIVILAATLGSALSFLAARHLFFERVQAKVREYPKFRAVNEAIRDEGWRVVGLLRLSPALPFSLQNWFLGITPVSFWSAQIATFFGIMPGTLLYIWVGSLGGQAGGDTSAWQYVGYAVGIAATLAVTVLVTRKARAKMREFEAA